MLLAATPQSDLVIQNLTVDPYSGLAGSQVTVSFSIHNRGIAVANPSTTNIRISKSPTKVDISDPLLVNLSTPSIAAGEAQKVSQTLIVPENLSQGAYFIWVILDVNSTANQFDENNDRSYRTFGVTRPAKSDLVVQNLTVDPYSGLAGSQVTVTFSIHNRGIAVANPSTTNIRISKSPTKVDISDPLLVNLSTPSIAAGEAQKVSQTLMVPENLPQGAYYIWVILDVKSTANQSDENNDRSYRTFGVTRPGTVAKSMSGKITFNGNPLENVIVVRRATNFHFLQRTKTNARGEYTFSAFNNGDYFIPASSGTINTPNLNEGIHGYLFSPSFCQIGIDGRACGGKNQLPSQNFIASLKPEPAFPEVLIKLPLPPGGWYLTVEAGGYTFRNSADPAHTDLSSGFYALDFAAVSGTPVLASLAGTVAAVLCHTKVPTQAEIRSGCRLGFGWNIVIRHTQNYYTRYSHLREKPTLVVGDMVQQGEGVGCVGSTGLSTGPHLHFQIYQGGYSSSFGLSSSRALARVRLETAIKSLPVVQFFAGETYQSNTIITIPRPCSA